MAEVHSWRETPDPRQLVEQAVAVLAAGRSVVFPTDTGYVVAVDPRHAAPPAGEHTLAVSGEPQAFELFPSLPPLARRIARRCWPGPLALQPGVPGPPLRAPCHAAIHHAMIGLQAPLAMTPLPAGPDSAGELDVALVIDDGPPAFPEGATMVRVDGKTWQVVHPGALSADDIREALACLIVFVCTGNTCRSPLAEALCKKRLAERLGCTPDELPARGYRIVSAGLSAYPGDEAAANAVAVASTYGMDLSTHQSRALDRELAWHADHLVCMTAGHLSAVREFCTELSCEPRLLSPTGVDLPDPVGQEEEVYRTCAEQIWADVETLLDHVLPIGREGS